MHDFQRVLLENFSKRFVLSNTTADDAGAYEVDVHTLDGAVSTAVFYVLPFSKLCIIYMYMCFDTFLAALQETQLWQCHMCQE